MKANGEDIKTIQELLRHSNYRVTADTYKQAVTPMKRAAQTKLVKMILLQQAGRGKTSVRRVSLSYRTLSNPRRKRPIPINHLFCWRPRRDLNPCYRRERANEACWSGLHRLAYCCICPVFTRPLRECTLGQSCMPWHRFAASYVTVMSPP
jgi:hypothetical protein